jgi:hypothetical protein
MDRAKWIGPVVVAWLLSGAGVAVAQSSTQPPPLGASLETCETSPLPAQRVATFVGSMPAIDGAVRMQMRFELQRRRPEQRHWRAVRGAQSFGVWETADPGRAGFVFHKRVDGLQVPASYRAIVRFRWLRDDGSVARRERRTTHACKQPDLRPDLVAGLLRAAFGVRPALALYTLVVRNDGRAPAGPFAVRVAGGTTEVAGLAAGQQLEVSVLAPACVPGAPVLAMVDADGRVNEADEHNSVRRPCPAGG